MKPLQKICGDGGANMGTVVDESASKQLMGRRHLKVVAKLLHLKYFFETPENTFANTNTNTNTNTNAQIQQIQQNQVDWRLGYRPQMDRLLHSPNSCPMPPAKKF